MQGTLYNDVVEVFNKLCTVRDEETGKSLYFRDPREKLSGSDVVPPEDLFSTLQRKGK